MPRLCDAYPGICLTTEEKARKNLSQGSLRMPVGKEYTEQSIHVNKTIRIHNLQNYTKYTKHTTIYKTIKKPKEHHYTATLHYTSPNYTSHTYRHFTPSHLHFTTPSFGLTHLHFLSFCFTTLHPTTLHYTSPNYTSLHLSTLHFSDRKSVV